VNASFLPRDVYLISRMPSDPQQGDIMPIAIISLVLAFVATLYPAGAPAASTRRGAAL
jgi:lipoprotein-releasing system permease protein